MRRVFLVSLFQALNVAAQFASFLLWGFLFGAGAEMDAFLTSVALPTVLATVTVGPLVSSLVPLLVEAQHRRSQAEAARFRGSLFAVFALGGALLAAALFVLAPLLIGLVAPGLAPDMRLLAARLLRIEVLSFPLAMAAGVMSSFYYAADQYYWPTIVPVFGTLAALLLLVAGQQRLGVAALAWGVVLSALVQALCFSRVLRGLRWRLDMRDPALAQLARRMLPLTAGNLYYKSDPLVDRFLLSFLPAGSISYLGYGQRITGSLSQVMTRGLVTSRFTRLSQQRLQGDADFKQGVNRLFRQVAFFAAPAAAGLALFIRPFLRLFLERGAFTALDAERTAAVVIAFSGLLAAGLLGSVMSSTFYALGDTKTIAAIGMAAFTLGIALKAAGVLLFSYAGVAAATSLYFLAALAAEMIVLQKKFSLFSGARIGRFLGRVALASLAALAAGLACRSLWARGWAALLAGALLFAASYLLASLLLKTVSWRELRQAWPLRSAEGQ